MEEILRCLPWLIGGGLMVGHRRNLDRRLVYSTPDPDQARLSAGGTWGQAVYPKTTSEDGERIKLLSQENAQLRAELGSIKDRLGNVERIVTDSGYSLTHQIEALRAQKDKDVQ